MFERFSRSWDLVKASGSVLRQDKELLLFPLISAGAVLLVVAAFALPMLGMHGLDRLSDAADGHGSIGTYLVAFLFYVSQYFVIFFFNTALVGAAMMRLDGKDPAFSDGMRIARSKLGAIFGYAIIAATVGMVLRVIQERVGFVGRIIVGLLGVGWTIATYLVVPVLAARDVGPIEAVKESAALLKETWGENVIGQAGMGIAFGFMMIGVIFCGGILIVLAALTHSAVLVVTAVALTVLAVVLTALVQSALAGIYAAALYRFATTGEGAQGFDAGLMKLAFAPK